MKLQCILLLSAAAMLPAQSPSKPKPASNPAPAKAGAPAAGGHATLADLQRDFQEKKLAALEAYGTKNATAADSGEALIEAANIAKELRRFDVALRLGEKPLRDAMANAKDNVNQLVSSASTLAEILVRAGKKDDGIALIRKLGEERSDVKGLKDHLDNNVLAMLEPLGAEPKPIDKEDIAGKVINLAEYKGKVLLIDFWATWCPPCVADMPNVIATYEKFHDKGFEIVGISLDKDREKLDKFVAEKGMKWRQYFDGKGWENEVSTAYGVRSIPSTWLIGTDGKVIEIGLHGKEIEELLPKLLAAKPAAAPAAAPKK